MTKKDLLKLRKRLPKHYKQLIISELPKGINYSSVYIHKVLTGERSNELIISTAIIVAEQHEERMKELAQAATGEKKLDKLKFNLQN